MIKVSKNFCRKLDKQREAFSANTDNFFALFIVFEWGKIFKSTMNKQQVKCNAKLRLDDFSVNVSIVVVAFRRQI